LNKQERDQIAQILQNHAARTYRHGDGEREFYEGLIEEWRTTGTLSGTLDRDTFLDFADEAMQDTH